MKHRRRGSGREQELGGQEEGRIDRQRQPMAWAPPSAKSSPACTYHHIPGRALPAHRPAPRQTPRHRRCGQLRPRHHLALARRSRRHLPRPRSRLLRLPDHQAAQETQPHPTARTAHRPTKSPSSQQPDHTRIRRTGPPAKVAAARHYSRFRVRHLRSTLLPAPTLRAFQFLRLFSGDCRPGGLALTGHAGIDGLDIGSLVADGVCRQHHPAVGVNGTWQRRRTAWAIRQSTPSPISLPAGITTEAKRSLSGG